MRPAPIRGGAVIYINVIIVGSGACGYGGVTYHHSADCANPNYDMLLLPNRKYKKVATLKPYEWWTRFASPCMQVEQKERVGAFLCMQSEINRDILRNKQIKRQSSITLISLSNE